MPVAFRTAGAPEQIIARGEAGSRNFSERKISVTESRDSNLYNVSQTWACSSAG